MNIKVLWIDDEFEKQQDFISYAEQYEIDVIPKGSHEEGMADLSANMHLYHAVILDAKVKLNQDDVVTNTQGLSASRDKLIRLNESGQYLPYFIFTGQPDFITNDMFRDTYGDFYIKGSNNKKLIEDIKDKVSKSDHYAIQSRYENVFRICDKYFDGQAQRKLTEILFHIHKPTANVNDEVYFTQIRIILESLFRVANKNGLLHDVCVKNGDVNLSESSLFLSGQDTKHLNVKCAKPHFSKLISDAVKTILFVTGAAGHTADPDQNNKYDFQSHKRLSNTPYLLFGLTFLLIDILVWFDSYLYENCDVQHNKSLWLSTDDLNEPSTVQTGKVINVHNERGFAFFKPDVGTENSYIHKDIVNQEGLKDGMSIEVQIEKYIDRQSQKMQTRVKTVKRLN